MADATKRLTKDAKIDYGSITINVDGRVTGIEKYRQNRSSKVSNPNDGFVYTSSTRESDGSFYYRYTGMDMAANITSLPIYDDKQEDAMFLSLEHYRNQDANEGIINYKIGEDGDDRINGHPTATDDFLYNEGNEFLGLKDVKNHSIDGEDSLVALDTALDGGYSKETDGGRVNFYDRFASLWTPELVKVRGMQGANIAGGPAGGGAAVAL